jgi:hypothetical protein
VLGGLCQRHAGHAWHGETLYLATLVALALALLLAHMGTWSLWGAALEADPTGPLALRVGLAHVAALALALALAVAGRRPALAVRCDDDARVLRLRQGARHLEVPYDAVVRAEALTPLHFHRVERRCRGVRVFRGGLSDAPLLRLTLAPSVGGDGLAGTPAPVVVGLDTAADVEALRRHLERAVAAAT